jgi:hypothetical protein
LFVVTRVIERLGETYNKSLIIVCGCRIHGKKAKLNFTDNSPPSVISTRLKKRSSKARLCKNTMAPPSPPLLVTPNNDSPKDGIGYVEENVVRIGDMNSYPSNQPTNSFGNLEFGSVSNIAPAMGNGAVSSMSDNLSDFYYYLDILMDGGLEESSEGSNSGFLSDGLLDSSDVTQDLVGNDLWNFQDIIPVFLGTGN